MGDAVEADADKAESIARTLQWFKELWLSNRDFCQIFERAVYADGSDWPDGFVITSGESDNRGMKWSLSEARTWLGYQPQDDVFS